jgi:methionine-rich copper-binding protein CopC
MRFLLAFLGPSVLSVLLAAVALAHAEPARVKPGQDAVLNAAPLEIAIEMSQEMARQAGANDIVVQDASGKEVTTQPAVIDNANRRKLSVPLAAGLPPGTYTVRWRTLSADDGDTASGNYSFKIDPAATPSEGTEVVRADLLGVQTGQGTNSPAVSVSAGSGGTSWVLLTAVAAGMFVLGAGTSFLLVQKRG